MRRFSAIARAAVIETMSQPLSAILFSVATLAVHLLPAFQYHRFGAPGRLARETGMSALFVFGLIFAVPAAVRAIGRELDTGIAASALALGVSRTLYFVGRLAGVLAVFAMFFVAVFLASALSSFSCMKAASFIEGEGVARVWGPAFAIGTSSPILAFAVAAVLNRFACCRFCMWTCILATAFQLPGLALLEGIAPLAAALPAFCALAAACAVYVTMAAALSTRLKVNGVTACIVAAVACGFFVPVKFLLPDLRVFWLAEGDAAATMPILAGMFLMAIWIILGCVSLEKKELE